MAPGRRREHKHTPARSLAGLRPIVQLVVPVLVVVALLLTENGAETNAFEEITAWSIFAVVMALISLAPLVGGGLGLDKPTAWSVGAVGTAGLVGYWVIIVLPGVSSNAGFMLTLATACAVIGCWLTRDKRASVAQSCGPSGCPSTPSLRPGGVNAAAAILGINASRLEPKSSLGGCPTRFMPGPAHLVTVETADDGGLRARETVAVVIAPSDYLPTKVVRPVHGPKGEITTPPDLTVRAALAI